MYSKSAFAVAMLAFCLCSSTAQAQTREDQVVNMSTAVLQEVMALPAKRIPHTLLADAQGVAIIPNVVKGGFIVGVRHGTGVLLVRDETGAWHAPVFVSLTGGSVGWQAGVQATDVVLVFKSQRSVNGIMNGKFTIGADASVAAGPVGREAAAATDAKLQAEIYSYSRSRGLFAGASLGGTSIQVDQAATAAYYAQDAGAGPAGGPPVVPASAVQLVHQLMRYTDPPTAVEPVEATPNSPTAAPLTDIPPIQKTPQTEDLPLKEQLAAASTKLFAVLDKSWQEYLALPQGVYEPNATPPFEQLVDTLQRYNKMFVDPQFTALGQNPEFIETRRLLQEYVESLQTTAATPAKLSLPKPPQ